jgi:hypothetical protein
VALLRLEDPDARANWEVFARFRALLLRHATLEDAYLDLVLGGNGAGGVPALFADHLAHAILRGILDRCGDGLRLRAAECLFRSQQVVTIEEGAVLLADSDTVELRARGATGGQGLAPVELPLLDAAGAEAYFGRSDRFDTVLDVGFTRPGLDALCRVLEAWVHHFLPGLGVRIQPVQSIRDERWRWHLGLDAEASAILDALYAGQQLPLERHADILSLFRLEIRDPELVRVDVRGRPVYMAMARDARGRLRLKPQNLLANLPLATAA